jgi:(R,R)-butanediol dehydrogenase/meso-butanediol dehydrogenase/diacetyl reductase
VRAATSTANEPWLALTTLPDPVPGPGDLVLRVDACGICGSDLHMAHTLRGRPGLVFGHELCGTVVAVGEGVAGHREGHRVVGFPLIGCRSCDACRQGATAKCPQAQLVGAQHPGGYAEYVRVGAVDSFTLPEGLSADQGALVEPLAVAHHALERTPREQGAPVLVLGAGPVGLAVALWARALGAREVVVSDPVPGRRALAEQLGATVVDPGRDDVGAAFADVTGAPPQAVLECIGRPGAVQHASEVAGVDAQVTLVGACTAPDTFRPLTPTSKELTLRFVVYYGRNDFARTLIALQTGELDPSPMVTGHVGLEQLPSRFAALVAGSSSDCKVLIHPWSAS